MKILFLYLRTLRRSKTCLLGYLYINGRVLCNGPVAVVGTCDLFIWNLCQCPAGEHGCHIGILEEGVAASARLPLSPAVVCCAMWRPRCSKQSNPRSHIHESAHLALYVHTKPWECTHAKHGRTGDHHDISGYPVAFTDLCKMSFWCKSTYTRHTHIYVHYCIQNKTVHGQKYADPSLADFMLLESLSTGCWNMDVGICSRHKDQWGQAMGSGLHSAFQFIPKVFKSGLYLQ